MMKILIVAATPFEIDPFKDYLLANFTKKTETLFERQNQSVSLLITGVGQVAMAYHLGCELSQHLYDIVINIGIAGTYRADWSLGKVVQVTSEQFAQSGAELADGSITDLFEMGLLEKNQTPYSEGKMTNTYVMSDLNLPCAKGITVDTTHGFERSISAITSRLHPDTESMEGGAFFYACISKNVKFLQLRGLSNYVEPRNKNRWKISLAIKKVNEMAILLLGAVQ